MAGRGLIIFISIIILLCLAAYVVRNYMPAATAFLLSLALILGGLIIAAAAGLIPMGFV